MAAWLGKAQPQRGASEPIKWRAGTGSTGSVSFSSWLRQLIDIEAFSWGAVFTSDVDSLPGQTAKYEIRGGESYYFVELLQLLQLQYRDRWLAARGTHGPCCWRVGRLAGSLANGSRDLRPTFCSRHPAPLPCRLGSLGSLGPTQAPARLTCIVSRPPKHAKT
jgi:hypothetical protein